MKQPHPIRFVPLSGAPGGLWRRPGSYAFAGQISQVPLSDTELLMTAHHLPVAIDYLNNEPRVVAVLDARFHRVPVIADDGRWQRGYMPLVLRCLPFRLRPGSTDALDVAINLSDADTPGIPILAEGKPTQAIRVIADLLHRHEEGKLVLQKAAEKLLIADVVTPLRIADLPGTTPSATRTMTVDRNKLAALSKGRAAHLVRDGFMPMDLAMACIFSQRLIPTLVSVAQEASADPVGRAEQQPVGAGFGVDIRVDHGELFSFERFSEADCP